MSVRSHEEKKPCVVGLLNHHKFRHRKQKWVVESGRGFGGEPPSWAFDVLGDTSSQMHVTDNRLNSSYLELNSSLAPNKLPPHLIQTPSLSHIPSQPPPYLYLDLSTLRPALPNVYSVPNNRLTSLFHLEPNFLMGGGLSLMSPFIPSSSTSQTHTQLPT